MGNATTEVPQWPGIIRREMERRAQNLLYCIMKVSSVQPKHNQKPANITTVFLDQFAVTVWSSVTDFSSTEGTISGPE